MYSVLSDAVTLPAGTLNLGAVPGIDGRWRRHRILLATALVASGWLAAGCGEESPTEPPPPPTDTTSTVSVAVWFGPSTVAPGDTTVLSVLAVPRQADARVNSIKILFPQLGDTTLTFGPPPGPGSFKVSLIMPLMRGAYEGQLDVTAWANVHGRADTATAQLTVRDDRPPDVTIRLSERAEPGDSVQLTVQATDNGALAFTKLAVAGAVVFTDSVAHAGELEYARSIGFRVEREAALGDSITVEAVAMDWKGAVDTARATLTIESFRPPILIARIASPPPDSLHNGNPIFVTGDTLHLVVEARDHLGLSSVGYASFDLGDQSIPTTDTIITVHIDVVIPHGLDSDYTAVRPFAVDASGNLTTGFIPIAVWAGMRRPFQRITATAPGPLIDPVHDPTRDLVFAASGDATEIVVFDLAALDYQPPIPLPAVPRSLDLSVSGDSLIAVLPETKQLGIVDLTSAARTVTTLELEDLPDRTPVAMRIAANNKAVVQLSFAAEADSVFTFVDLSTGNQGLRAQGSPPPVHLARSADRSTVVARTGAVAYRYTAATDSIDGQFPLGGAGQLVLSTDGSLILTGLVLRDRDFSVLNDAFPVAGPLVFAPDGAAAYVCPILDAGYRKVRVPDGALLERVFVPVSPRGCLLLTDDRLLIFDADGAPIALAQTG